MENIRILLADDDPDYIEINRTILEAHGYVVDEAYTSTEAIEKIKNQKYDMLILDLMMEEKDAGFTVAYAVRENKLTRDLPILMLSSAQEQTGFSFEVDRDKEWMKVDEFAAKPLKPAELLSKVKELIKQDI
jgi:two-component system, OmpR family, alkaline phosphatase synthesis response regulator PhoP